MKIIGNIIISLAIAFSVINLLMAFWGEKNISIYFLVNAIVYLIVTQLYSGINDNVRWTLNWINAAIFVVFLVILGINVSETLKVNP